ncbi:MAG: class I SAM-dependent methyltransferase, partial [Cyclobacteriaceae bacterium]
MTSYASREYTEITDIRDPEKIRILLDLIPDDVHSIIDIGCGNGLITNKLNEKYNVLGCDVNSSKLRYVKGPKLQASCDDIPREDRSFDMVFSSEMLEHLPERLYRDTLKEFSRLAESYVLITVPYNEDLHKLEVKCGSCGQIYHKNGHLRSFDETSFNDKFSGFKTVYTSLYGKPVRKYIRWLADLKHSLTPPNAWIPKHWVITMGVNYHFCIHCGHRNELKPVFNPFA